jgi:hypothetical protein
MLIVNPDCHVVGSGYCRKGARGVHATYIRYGWIAVEGAEETQFWYAVPSPIPGQTAEGVQEQQALPTGRVIALINRKPWIGPPTPQHKHREVNRGNATAYISAAMGLSPEEPKAA